ncbi:MAG: hypothetical protein WBP45_06935 [Daejeonella sp.]
MPWGSASATTNYEYYALGDCDHPAAGYCVATTTCDGESYYSTITNQQAYEEVEFANSWIWWFLPH